MALPAKYARARRLRVQISILHDRHEVHEMRLFHP